mgnify:FL=1|jgi:hypothetical protein|tara:strand:+ start:182 stop:814 length:633 start_codon:yes stop_codon:yes gene_type:complete
MTYSQLTANIQDICESTFTSDELALFVQQTEQFIYNTVQFPALRKNVSGTITSGNKYLEVPTDYLYTYSLAVINTDGSFDFLLNKDVNFIREAYPTPTSTGTPKHYANFNDERFILGPTPSANLTVELHYGYYPESIVTASTLPWLGENFDSALLNGSLVEALRFMKGEPDLVAMYDKMFGQSITLLKVLGDGKLRSDTYRDGQYRQVVT